MLAFPTLGELASSRKDDTAPRTSAADLHLMILEHLAAECHERPLLALLGPNPLVLDLLDADVHHHPSAPSRRRDGGGEMDDDPTPTASPNVVKSLMTTTVSPPTTATTTTPLLVPIHDVLARIAPALRTLRSRKMVMDLVLSGAAFEAKRLLVDLCPRALAATPSLFSHASDPDDLVPPPEPSGNDPAAAIPTWYDRQTASAPTAFHPPTLAARLDCQSFIELVRANNQKGALEYSQSHLRQYTTGSSASSPAAHALVAAVFGLMAHADPYKSPLADFLDPRHRRALAADLNRAMLQAASGPPPAFRSSSDGAAAAELRDAMDVDGSSAGSDERPNSKPIAVTSTADGRSAIEVAVRQLVAAAVVRGHSGPEVLDLIRVDAL
ncbi:hypothetical protein BC828DRAFT_404928 [Blastocladiella britannica]|nr:hypothetical protein BC828DRAFT_404928 [Blastocladiella britannica]